MQETRGRGKQTGNHVLRALMCDVGKGPGTCLDGTVTAGSALCQRRDNSKSRVTETVRRASPSKIRGSSRRRSATHTQNTYQCSDLRPCDT